MQQVGNAVGVALIGLVFFSADGGHARAFQLSVVALAVLLAVVAACAHRLPQRPR